MKKKLLSVLLVGAMAATMFAGCGSSSSSSSDSSSDSSSSTTTADADDDEDFDYGSGSITVWAAEEAVEFTQSLCDAFIAEYGLDYTITVEACGEGDAASNMITDVEGGADIYAFAQDQMARLVAAGALQEIVGTYAETIASENSAASVAAATVGDSIYAFPMTADNGYFLYYDSSVITDPTSLEQIIADCEAAGKNFYYSFGSWYLEAIFFATGCSFTYEADADGNFTAANIDLSGGVVAVEELIEIASSSAFVSESSVSKATNIGAIIDGTWDKNAAMEVLGDNYACAELPSFVGSDGNTYHMSGFSGFKLLGVKPQTEAGKLAVCYMLAAYMTNAEAQLARFEAVGWGPSNIEAAASEAVQADAALAALAAQGAYTIPQGQYATGYWDIVSAIGDDVIAGNITDIEATLAQLQADLEAAIE